MTNLTDPVLESMSVLDEMAGRFPEAVSLAGGRPHEGMPRYGRTEGVIHALRSLRSDERDVLFAVAPTYIGIAGAARLVGLPVRPVRGGPVGIDLADLAEQVAAARRDRLRPRGCYVIPSFTNPSGISMSLPVRHRLLELAERENLLILEDNPYGLCTEASPPSVQALDTSGCVISLGSGPTARETEAYQRNRCAMLNGLSRRFPVGGTPAVSWTVPDGGSFVVVTVPFEVDDTLLARSAAEYGVLWTPIHHFYDGPCHQLRLSYHAFDIEPGLDRLAKLIKDVAAERPGERAAAELDAVGRVLVGEFLVLADDSCVALLPHVLRIAVDMGLADRLADEPVDVDTLAGEIGADPDALRRLLRALASVGLVSELADDRFELSGTGQALRFDGPLSVRESVTQVDSRRAWTMAGETFRTGRPVSLDEDSAGTGFFEHKDRDSAAKRSFLRRMRERAGRCYGQIAPLVEWGSTEVVLDVGGGDGFLLDQVLRHSPDVSGMLFDRPAVIETVALDGRLDDRIRLEAGDFFDKIPPGADTHLICSVLHDWDDRGVVTILSRSRAALNPGGRLLVVEMLRPEGNTWHPSKWSDLGMLVLTGGRERSEVEFRELLSRSGYVVSSVRGVPGSYFSLIEARPEVTP